jgi:hypothetical protein
MPGSAYYTNGARGGSCARQGTRAGGISGPAGGISAFRTAPGLVMEELAFRAGGKLLEASPLDLPRLTGYPSARLTHTAA